MIGYKLRRKLLGSVTIAVKSAVISTFTRKPISDDSIEKLCITNKAVLDKLIIAKRNFQT